MVLGVEQNSQLIFSVNHGFSTSRLALVVTALQQSAVAGILKLWASIGDLYDFDFFFNFMVEISSETDGMVRKNNFNSFIITVSL